MMMRGISPTAQDRIVRPHRSRDDDSQLRAEIAALQSELEAQRKETDRLRDIVCSSPAVVFVGQKIMAAVAAAYGLKLSDIRGVSREKKKVIARHHAIWLVRQSCPAMSLPYIGRICGGRDHSSIFHAINAHQSRAERGLTLPDPDISELVKANAQQV